MEGVQGNFMIFNQKQYIYFLSSNNESLRLLVISNRRFVRSQLHLFSCEWGLASTIGERERDW